MGILPVQAKLNVDVKADLTPIIQATADTISTSHKGIAKLLNAFVGPWIANRERAIALLQAQTQHDCQQIAEGELIYQAGRLLSVPDQRPLPNIYETIHGLNHQADAKRLEAAILEVARQISKIPAGQISDEPISQTFFNRWRREAEMIDEDELRQWWAGLLKEEAIHTSRIALQTLDVVKYLTKEICLRFVDVCQGAIKDELVVSYDNRPIFGSYDDVIQFQNYGLVSNLQAAAKICPKGGNEELKIIESCDGTLGVTIQPANLWIHTFSLTRAGCDLLRVIGSKPICDKEVRVIYEFLKAHNLESGELMLVDTESSSIGGEWEWRRGHRPACFE